MYKILLVDDDRIVRFDFKRFKKWNQYGFCIIGEAEDGYEALQKIDAETYDLAFVDIKMPRIDGLGFLSALKEKRKELCVIIVSGHSEFEYARQGFKLGAFDYLIKPVDEKCLCSLLESVKKHLDELNEQKFRSPYPISEEDTLFASFINQTGEVFFLAKKFTEKIVMLYKNDPSKIVALLDNSYNNLIERLLCRMPYLSQICKIKRFPETFSSVKGNIPVVSWYINALANLAEQINNLELNSRDSVIHLFCQYVLNNLDKEFSMESAAIEIGYNSKYISKIFKEKTGETCISYITRIKMQQALNLILSGKYKNYEISKILGYKTPDYFCSLFKRHYGITPTEYKTANTDRM